MSRRLRGAFAVQVARMQRDLVAAGGTGPDEIRCPCGQVIPPKNWDLHVRTCRDAQEQDAPPRK